MVSNENSLKQYLLGALGEAEQLALEEKLLLDDEEFEQLLIAEDELTDSYVRNALPPEERTRFEQHFLCTSERQQKLRFALIFHRHLDRAASSSRLPERVVPSKNSWLSRLSGFLRTPHPVRGYALIATCVLLALGGSWLMFKMIRLQNEVVQLRAQSTLPQTAEQELRQHLAETNARREQLERALQASQAQIAQLETTRPQAPQETPRPASSSSIAAFVLTPGALVRSSPDPTAAAINQVTIPAAANTVKLQLELEKDQYPLYRATLQTQGGTVLKHWGELQPQAARDGKTLLLQFPAALLPGGSYSLRLEGVTAEGRAEKADQFHFRVARK